MTKQFHGNHKSSSYFEGWYLKHQQGQYSIAFIPALHINAKGEKRASIQIITNEFSLSIPFPIEKFAASSQHFSVSIGDNLFTEKGLSVNLKTEEYHIEGRLKYGPLTTLNFSLMGPFHFIPFMQCNHDILSLYHEVSGYIKINDKIIHFIKDIGYIEKDWGCSFPKSYQWTHCMLPATNSKAPFSIMVSIASIPFGPFSFTGCLACIYHKKRTYLFATYKGVKLCTSQPQTLILSQGTSKLHISFNHHDGHPLKAPIQGHMGRTVNENISCTIQYQLFKKNRKLFDITSNHASYEKA